MCIQKQMRLSEENLEKTRATAALRELAASWEYARDVGSDPWEFAVEIGDLVALGLGRSGLRWLATKGYVQHGREVASAAPSRRFQSKVSLAFTARTCFLLTDAGRAWLAADGSTPAVLRLDQEDAVPSPHWDQRMRTLYLGDRVVKLYRVLAPNQEKVLSAFEEESWPHVIDDPIPPDPAAESSSEMRLRDTIRRLNSNQVNHLLHFYGDGTGCHVLWEAVTEATLPLRAVRRKAA